MSTWCPTGMSEPIQRGAHDHSAPWPFGVVRAFGPSANCPFGDYPSWYVRLAHCPVCWSDWEWVG